MNNAYPRKMAHCSDVVYWSLVLGGGQRATQVSRR